MSSQTDLVENQTVMPSYSAGFIVLSYIVSLTGCATTLELLHRRTSRFGLYNWYLLISSSITMGGIGIWCMHYIGNRAIVLENGGLKSQILYSSGFTAISFFLPIGVLMLAFYFIGITERLNLVFVGIAGTMTGIAICGMHYVGQLGIVNYHCSYDVPHVVGAAIIAVFASNVALSMFFLLRASWIGSWWKKILSASFLAATVSGMHWTAAVGTSYSSKGLQQPPSELSSGEIVIVCTTLVSTSFTSNHLRNVQ